MEGNKMEKDNIHEPLTMEVTLPKWALKHIDKICKELLFEDIDEYLVYLIRRSM
jgi:hypothetical protein